jgi:predicted histone-like DNA-binding protein
MKPNPLDRSQVKWYANAIISGRITLSELAKEISGRSSLTKGDTENVLSNFVDELPTFLKLGMSIKLGDLGSLRLTISSEGVDNREDFTRNNIKGVKIVFTPSPELKKALENIHLEEEK